jgi:DNA polymerase-3 subunit delta'
MNGNGTACITDKYPWLDSYWSFFARRLEADRLAHAILIVGPAGCGKTALAGAMVARLLCRESQPTACGSCRSCSLLRGQAHPDYFDLQPEEGSKVVKVDQVRGLISRLDLTTSISERKVAFIRPAEAMNAASANALLKSLEEPAGNTVLILVSDNPGSLPATIRSRCQSISVTQPDRQKVIQWLQARSGKPADAVRDALDAAGGSPLRAAEYVSGDSIEAFKQVRNGLATLLDRPGAVSVLSQQLNELTPVDLWRWFSMCTGDAIKSSMTGTTPDWLPACSRLNAKTLLQLQKQADINRRLSDTPIRGDLLLQDWLIKWAEQVI